MKDYKIDLSGYEGKVREVVSEAIQRHAFELGYKWKSCGKTVVLEYRVYLFFNNDCSITYVDDKETCYFELHEYTLISAADFLALTPEDVKDAPKEPEFKPFDRVLARDYDNLTWNAHFYSHREENRTFVHRMIGGLGYHQCIPYEGNEHLLGTTEEGLE